MPRVEQTTTARVEVEARDTDDTAGHTSVAEPEIGKSKDDIKFKDVSGEKTLGETETGVGKNEPQEKASNTAGSGTQQASTPTMAPQEETTAAAKGPATEHSAGTKTVQTHTTAEPEPAAEPPEASKAAKADPPPDTAQQDKQREPEAKAAAEQPEASPPPDTAQQDDKQGEPEAKPAAEQPEASPPPDTAQQNKQREHESAKAAAPAKDSASADTSVKPQVIFTEKDNFYHILGVSPGCTNADQLKKAYKSRSLLCHPDKHGGSDAATAQFQLLQKAYDTLKDPASKAKYDQQVLDRLPKVSTPRRKAAQTWDDLPEEVKSAAVSKTERDKLKGAAKLQAEKAAKELAKSAAKAKARDKAKADREAKKAQKAAAASAKEPKANTSPKLKRTAKAKAKTSPKKRPAPTSTSPKPPATSGESKKGKKQEKDKTDKEPPVPRQQIHHSHVFFSVGGREWYVVAMQDFHSIS